MFHCTGSHMTLKEEKKMFERKGQKLFVNYLSPGDIQRWYYLFFFIVTVQYTVSLRVAAQENLDLEGAASPSLSPPLSITSGVNIYCTTTFDIHTKNQANLTSPQAAPTPT